MNSLVFSKMLLLFLIVCALNVFFEYVVQVFSNTLYFGIDILIFFSFIGLFFCFIFLGFLFPKNLVLLVSILYGMFVLFFRSFYLEIFPDDFYVIFTIYYPIFSIIFYIVFSYCKTCFIGLALFFVFFVFMLNKFDVDDLVNGSSVKHCFGNEELFLKFKGFFAQSDYNYYVDRDGFCVVFFGLSEEQDAYIAKVVDDMILELYFKH